MTPGLANKIAMRKATKICCNFPETLKYLPEGKAVLTGSPIRQELLLGNKAAGLDLCNFTTDKPIILVVKNYTIIANFWFFNESTTFNIKKYNILVL